MMPQQEQEQAFTDKQKEEARRLLLRGLTISTVVTRLALTVVDQRAMESIRNIGKRDVRKLMELVYADIRATQRRGGLRSVMMEFPDRYPMDCMVV